MVQGKDDRESESMKPFWRWKMNRTIVLFLLALLFCPLITGCKNKEIYKKEIEQKGVVYSEESFLNEVKAGDRNLAELFLKAGMDVNAKGADGHAALLVAAEKGDMGIAHLLIKHGADLNVKDTGGYTALMYAAYQGNLAFVKLLIENGADVHAKDKAGWTALKYAFINQKKEVAALLIKAGAKKK
jgi:ankyrin repeat protein